MGLKPGMTCECDLSLWGGSKRGVFYFLHFVTFAASRQREEVARRVTSIP